MGMTRDEMEKLMECLSKDSLQIWKEKNKEYSLDDNPFHNFDDSAKVAGVDRKTVLLIFLQKHLNAIFTYIREGHLYSNEPIECRITDARNYLDMLYCMIQEEKGK